MTEGFAFRVSRAGASDHMKPTATAPPAGAIISVADDNAQGLQFRDEDAAAKAINTIASSLPIIEPASSGRIMSAEERTSQLAGDVAVCDREPIHAPGSIQPHGLLLIADAKTLTVIAGAGDIEDRLEADWVGKQLGELIGQDASFLLPFDAVAAPNGTRPVAGNLKLSTSPSTW